MLHTYIFFSALLDPERLLARASHSVSEGHGWLVSYQHSIRFTEEHNRLAKLMRKLDVIAGELEEISQSDLFSYNETSS